MEFIIEIGDENQKQLIEQELKYVEAITETCSPDLNLRQLIVASNFEAKINAMEGVETYKAERGINPGDVLVAAKIVKVDDGFAIILSPHLFTDMHDIQTRCFVVLHELSHIVNRLLFPPIPNDSMISYQYLYHLYGMYDEYTSDRFAYNLVEDSFSSKSSHWNSYPNKQCQWGLSSHH
jgi:hypothetical protein